MGRHHHRKGRKMTKVEAAVLLPSMVICFVCAYLKSDLPLSCDSFIGDAAMEDILRSGILYNVTFFGSMLPFMLVGIIFVVEMIKNKRAEFDKLLFTVMSIGLCSAAFIVGSYSNQYITQIRESDNRGLFRMTRLLIDIKSDLKNNDCDVYTVNECKIYYREFDEDYARSIDDDESDYKELVAEFFMNGVSVAKTQITNQDHSELMYKFPEGYESTISIYKRSRFLRGYDTIETERPDVSFVDADESKLSFPKPPYEKYYVIEHIDDKLVYRRAFEKFYDRLNYEEFDKHVSWSIIEEGTADDAEATHYYIEDIHLKGCKDNEVLDTVISEPYEIALYCTIDGVTTRLSNVFSYKDIDRPAEETEPETEFEYPPYEEFYIVEKVGSKLVWSHRFDDYDEFYEEADKYVYWIGFQEGTADEEHDFTVDIAGSEFPMFEHNEAPAYFLHFGREAALFCNIGGKQTRVSNVIPHSEAG